MKKFLFLLVLVVAAFAAFPASIMAQDGDTWSFQDGNFKICGYGPGGVLVKFDGREMIFITDEDPLCIEWAASIFRPGDNLVTIEDERLIMTFTLRIHANGRYSIHAVKPVGKPLPTSPAFPFIEDDGTCADLRSFQRVGSLAVVNDADDQPMTLRSSASRTAARVAQVPPKTQLLIEEGPFCAESAIWWGARQMDQLNAELGYFAEVTGYGYNVKPWSLTEPFFGEESFTNICAPFSDAVAQQTELPTVGFSIRPSCDAEVVLVMGGLSNVRTAGNMSAEVIAKTPQGALLPVRGAQWDGARWWLEVFWGSDEDQKGFVSCGSKQDLLSFCPANPPQ